MTPTITQTIHDLEAAPTDERCREILSEQTTNRTFRRILDLTYDPFVVVPDAHVVIDSLPFLPDDPIDQERIEPVLLSTWDDFERDVRDGLSASALASRWSSSRAWTIFARVLSKTFHVPFDVANMWGTIPLFEAGVTQEQGQLPSFPFLTLAELSPVRAFLIVRNPLSKDSSRAVAQVFDETGCEMTACMSDRLRKTLRHYQWTSLLLDAKYDDGIVYEGFLLDIDVRDVTHENDVFAAFDAVPLSKFKQQHATAPFRERVADVLSLRLRPSPHLLAVTYVEASSDEHIEILSGHKVTDYPEAGVIAFDDRASYPYHASSSGRVWLRKPR